MSETRYEIVIVGGGIYGASVAYDLATSGKQVLLLEAGEIASGASGGPGQRGVRASGRDVRELAITARAQERWLEFQGKFKDGVGYTRTGGLTVYEVPVGLRKGELRAELATRAAVQTSMGAPTELIDGDRAREIEPELSANISGALYCPNDGVGDHTYATRTFAREAENAGAVIRTHSKVDSVVYEGGRATGVRLESGEHIGVEDQLLLLCNGAVKKLVEPVLTSEEIIPIWSHIPQMMYVSNPNNRKINGLIGHRNRKLAAKQLSDGTVMLSGGLTVEHDADGGLLGSLAAMGINLQDAVTTFPFLEKSEFQKVDGSRPETFCLDGVPCIGKPAAAHNVIFGTGWSGHGFAISLGFAESLANWVNSGEHPLELLPFSHTRFRPTVGSDVRSSAERLASPV